MTETPAQRLTKTQNAYRRLFPFLEGEPAGDVRVVLSDLAKFCKIDQPPLAVSPDTKTVDPIATGVMIGRQEVYARLEAMLHMPRRQRYTSENYNGD